MAMKIIQINELFQIAVIIIVIFVMEIQAKDWPLTVIGV